MKVFQLIKRVGGFCHLQSFQTAGFGCARRVPVRYLPTLLMVPRQPSFLPRSSISSTASITTTTRTTTTTHQTAQPFQDVHSNNDNLQGTSQFSIEANQNPAIDQVVFDAYKDVMTDVFSDFPPGKPNKKVTEEEFLQVKEFLLSDNTYSDSPLDVAGDDFSSGQNNNDLRRVLNIRKEHVLETANFTEHQFDLAMRCIATMASKCAKRKEVPPMIVAWSKIKDTGMRLRPNFLSTFLYVFGLEEEYLHFCFEIATFHDLLYEPTENSVYLRIKALVTMDDPGGAEKLLRELSEDKKECKRLRTFTPIITHYCDKGDAHSILRVWKQMRAEEGVYFDSETYALILGSLARNRFFHRDAKPISGIEELGLSQSGPKLLDEIMTEMAESLIEISEEAAVRLCNDFHTGFSLSSDATKTNVTGDSFQEVPLCLNDGEDLREKGLSAGRVTIESTTALCPSTGARLRQLTLDQHQRKHVHDTLLNMAATQQKDYGARYQNRTKYNFSQVAEKELRKFADWLGEREGGPLTAFVDGANVAYFGQGTVKYSQIVKVVEELEKMGERPLVIMPRKYVNASFRLANGSTQKLAHRDLKAITRLVNAGKLFIVPAQCFDDYYWMLASVSDQNGANLEVSPTDGDTARFPGIRPMLISNDQMRDHKLELLEPRLFRRWYSSQVVTYAISSYEEDEWENRTVRFMPADFFSREIQGNVFDRGGRAGTAWHLPVSGWEPRADRLCIAVNQ